MALNKVKAYGFRNIKNNEIGNSINGLVKSLNVHVLDYIAETKDTNFRSYYELLNKKSKEISFNSKSITYQEKINFSYSKLDFDNEAINYASTENSLNIFDLLNDGENPYDIWNGEYPFITYNVIRIGNLNYEFLTFTR